MSRKNLAIHFLRRKFNCLVYSLVYKLLYIRETRLLDLNTNRITLGGFRLKLELGPFVNMDSK